MHNKMQLSNGLNIVYQRLEGYKSVCVGVWIKAGSANEDRANNGISHFIEHMLFKGTEKRSAKEIALIIDGIGGEINAYTAKECTCYYAKLLGEDLEVGFDVLSDMIQHSTFETEHMEVEKTVILDEINMYEDSAEDLVEDILTGITFGNHALSLPILGTKETVSGFQREDILAYYSKYYVANNAVISIAGDFDESELEMLCEKYFGEMPQNDQLRLDAVRPEFHSACGHKYKDNEQVQVSIDLQGVPYDDHRSYDLMLLSNIFGGNNSSMLFQKIREESGLSYSIFSQPNFYDDIGTLNISFGVAKENLEQTMKLIIETINLLKQNRLSEEDVEHARAHLRGSFVLGLEGTDNYMDLIGRLELFTQKEKNFDEMMAKIDNIKRETVNALIDLCFEKEKIALAIVGDVDEHLTEMLFNMLKEGII
ncbi:M16 family metallopeptidase [Fusibacter ferrireducens]|uniref:Insulinase family protein n=1 Tax=Fusibacter ferrireducens TaxID=2785058 RepID=A0ABR9ZMU0_9FIRM|nr:pitrilysin family protein [Fusibacter ferrireducens]MBF4691778.1 insulinase family protein [Fusibacter ferrireducens]